MTNHVASLEVTEPMKYLPVLDYTEQLEVLSKSRLSLAVNVPAEEATLEE
jgi:hypothetical protein